MTSSVGGGGGGGGGRGGGGVAASTGGIGFCIDGIGGGDMPIQFVKK
jgi:hypothetical protein